MIHTRTLRIQGTFEGPPFLYPHSDCQNRRPGAGGRTALRVLGQRAKPGVQGWVPFVKMSLPNILEEKEVLCRGLTGACFSAGINYILLRCRKSVKTYENWTHIALQWSSMIFNDVQCTSHKNLHIFTQSVLRSDIGSQRELCSPSPSPWSIPRVGSLDSFHIEARWP